MKAELRNSVLTPKPDTDLTMTDALERLKHAEAVRESRRQRLDRAKRDSKVAVWVANYFRELVKDIEARDAGRLTEVRRSELPGEPCEASNTQDNSCGNQSSAYRTVVWTANGRLTATFCGNHRRHAEHFGKVACDHCGSEMALTLIPRGHAEPVSGNEVSARKGVPIEKWGRDHWAVFLHIYNLCTSSTDGLAYPDLRVIKCNPDRHPDMVPLGIALTDAGMQEPVRLNDGTELPFEEYDGWDCLADVEGERLLENIGTAYSPCYVLTEFGTVVASQIRQYRKHLGDRGRPRKLDNFRYRQDLAQGL